MSSNPNARLFANTFMAWCQVNGWTATMDRLQAYVHATLESDPHTAIPPIEDVWHEVPNVNIGEINAALGLAPSEA